MSLALSVIHALIGCNCNSVIDFHEQGTKRSLTATGTCRLVLEGIMGIGKHPVNFENRAMESVNQAVSVIHKNYILYIVEK